MTVLFAGDGKGFSGGWFEVGGKSARIWINTAVFQSGGFGGSPKGLLSTFQTFPVHARGVSPFACCLAQVASPFARAPA